MSDHRIGFIGAGKMASALAKGLVSAGFTSPSGLTASDIVVDALDSFVKSTGGSAARSNAEVIGTSDIVVLAVKPHQIVTILSEISPRIADRHLVVSIAAGIRLATYEDVLPARTRVVRVMPNTPCLVGAAAAGFSRGRSATDNDASLVKSMLDTVGIGVEVPEQLLDAVTGLSGSGPAFVYQFIEALSDGGVRVGLPRTTATQLAAQTVLGAAKMVLETGIHPGELKDMVTSPGGTTIAGVHALERGGLRGTVMNAVEAAAKRASDLS